MKKEKGSVTLFVLISCMFMIIILLVVNIGVMNKNRSQEKELEEISKQYNQNETDLDNTYANTLEKQEYISREEYEDALYYKPGDTYTTSMYTGGYVTNSGDTFRTTLILNKTISDKVTSVTVESIQEMGVRQDGKYILNLTSDLSGVECKTNIRTGTNIVALSIKINDKDAEVKNNDVVGISMTAIKLKFN